MSGDGGFEGFSWRGWGKGFSQRGEGFSGRGGSKRRRQAKGGRVKVVHFILPFFSACTKATLASGLPFFYA